MPQVRQRDALGVLTKPRLVEIAAMLQLDHAQGDPAYVLPPEKNADES